MLSTFTVNPDQLRFSFVTNASVAFEQKLPRTTYLRIELMDRRARNIWTFINPGASTLPDGPFSGQFTLTNNRRDHYDSAGMTVAACLQAEPRGVRFLYAIAGAYQRRLRIQP